MLRRITAGQTRESRERRIRWRFADVGIAIHNSPGSQIYNNTIYQAHSYPNAIEYRFPETINVLIGNNLVNRRIRSQGGAQATLSANVTGVVADTFMDPSDGDLHLRPGIKEIVDRGVAVPDLTDDFDGQIRPQGDGVDIGADETCAARGRQSGIGLHQ